MSKEKSNKISRGQVIGACLAVAALLVLMLMPCPQGMTVVGQKALALFTFALIMWIARPIPIYLTSIAVVLLLPLLGVVEKQSYAFGMLGKDIIWLMVAAFVLTSAMSASNLGKRIALFLITRFAKTPTQTLLVFVLVNYILAFFVPSTTARASLIIPIALVILEVYKATPGKSRFGKLLALQGVQNNAFATSVVMTATSAQVLAVGFINEQTGAHIGYMQWLYECSYCTIRNRHWDNRGFLYGPICPIYGFGAILCLFLFGDLPLYLIQTNRLQLPLADNGLAQIPLWQIFLICTVGSAIMEYLTSYLLEKLFHAVWWDYSHVPLNLHGRICLPASIGFGLAGVVISKWVIPLAMEVPDREHPLTTIVLALLLAFYLGMDSGLTIESLIQLTHRLDLLQESFDNRMESTVQIASLGPGAIAVAAGSAAREAA